MNLQEALQGYLDEADSLNRAKATLEWHRESFKHILSHWDSQSPLTVGLFTSPQITGYRKYLKDRGLKPASINNYLRSFKAFLNWAVEQDYITKMPVVKLVVEDSEPKSVISPLDFQKLLVAADKENSPLLRLRAKAVLMLLYETGMRASELCGALANNLQLIEVDGAPAGVLFIEGAKRGGYRQVVLSEATYHVISEYRLELARPHGRGYRQRGTNPAWLFTSTKDLDRALTTNGLRQLCRRLTKLSGVEFSPHCFRHTFATAFMENSNGSETESLTKLAGWKSREMLKVYVHFNTQALVRAARRNSPKAGRVG